MCTGLRCFGSYNEKIVLIFVQDLESRTENIIWEILSKKKISNWIEIIHEIVKNPFLIWKTTSSKELTTIIIRIIFKVIYMITKYLTTYKNKLEDYFIDLYI